MVKYLARWLCVNRACSPRADHNENTADVDAMQLQDSSNFRMNEENNHEPNESPSTSSSAASAAEMEAAGQVVSRTERLLASIHDQLETFVNTTTQLRREKEEHERMMNDWMVAAAVIDRIFFILIAIAFVVGTIAILVSSSTPHDTHLTIEDHI